MDNDQVTAKESDTLSTQERNRKVLFDLVEQGKLPEPRAMTRKERRAFDASGNNFFKPKSKDTRPFAGIVDDATDWVLDHIYPDFDFDDLPNNICNAFASYTVGLTYKDELAEKN